MGSQLIVGAPESNTIHRFRLSDATGLYEPFDVIGGEDGGLGSALARVGDRVLVSAPKNHGSGQHAGLVFVFDSAAPTPSLRIVDGGVDAEQQLGYAMHSAPTGALVVGRATPSSPGVLFAVPAPGTISGWSRQPLLDPREMPQGVLVPAASPEWFAFGAAEANHLGVSSGIVLVLESYADRSWRVRDHLVIANRKPGDALGSSVASLGTGLFAGAPGRGQGSVFEFTSGQPHWTQVLAPIVPPPGDARGFGACMIGLEHTLFIGDARDHVWYWQDGDVERVGRELLIAPPFPKARLRTADKGELIAASETPDGGSVVLVGRISDIAPARTSPSAAAADVEPGLAVESRFFRQVTAHYDIQFLFDGALDPTWPDLMESAWERMAKFFGAVPRTESLLGVRVARDHRQIANLGGVNSTQHPGWYSRRLHAAFVTNEWNDPQLGEWILRHELAHQFHDLIANSDARWKAQGWSWLQEGLAMHLERVPWESGGDASANSVRLITDAYAAKALLDGGHVAKDRSLLDAAFDFQRNAQDEIVSYHASRWLVGYLLAQRSTSYQEFCQRWVADFDKAQPFDRARFCAQFGGEEKLLVDVVQWAKSVEKDWAAMGLATWDPKDRVLTAFAQERGIVRTLSLGDLRRLNASVAAPIGGDKAVGIALTDPRVPWQQTRVLYVGDGRIQVESVVGDRVTVLESLGHARAKEGQIELEVAVDGERAVFRVGGVRSKPVSAKALRPGVCAIGHLAAFQIY